MVVNNVDTIDAINEIFPFTTKGAVHEEIVLLVPVIVPGVIVVVILGTDRAFMVIPVLVMEIALVELALGVMFSVSNEIELVVPECVNVMLFEDVPNEIELVSCMYNPLISKADLQVPFV